MADLLQEQFPATNELSREDLKDLLGNDAYFDSFCHTLHQSLDLDRARREILLANEAECLKNLEYRSQLEQTRTETAQAFTQARYNKERCPDLLSKQDQAYISFQPNSQIMRLRKATIEDDRDSERLVSAFQDGSIEEDEFVRQYRNLRQQFHRRAILLAKSNTSIA